MIASPNKNACVCACVLSRFRCVRLFATPWTEAQQAPLSMGFSRQEYWSGLPIPSPRDLPDPGIEPQSPALQADSLPLGHWGSPFLTAVGSVTNDLTMGYHSHSIQTFWHQPLVQIFYKFRTLVSIEFIHKNVPIFKSVQAHE